MTSSRPVAPPAGPRPTEPRPVAAFAHRGGALHPDLLGLENSLRAFAHAVDLGYTDLETDAHTTSDGVLVAFHDDVLDRVTDARGSIATTSYDDLRRARIGGSEEIPTIAGLMAALPGARFNIDLKSEAAGPALAGLLEAEAAWDRVLVGSFSPRLIGRFRALTGGRVQTAAHPGEVAAFRALASARLARLVTRGRVGALQVPERRGPLRVLTPALLARAHDVGVPVHVWTVDEPARMHALLDLGVDGIFTDRTDLLRSVLQERGQWAPGHPSPPRPDEEGR